MHFKRKVIVFSSSWRFLLNLSSVYYAYDQTKGFMIFISISGLTPFLFICLITTFVNLQVVCRQQSSLEQLLAVLCFLSSRSLSSLLYAEKGTLHSNKGLDIRQSLSGWTSCSPFTTKEKKRMKKFSVTYLKVVRLGKISTSSALEIILPFLFTSPP